jgi:hypothetical protein
MILEFTQPRIGASRKDTKSTARRTVAVLVSDSEREARERQREWKRAKIAGELVQVRRYTRGLRAAGAAVTLHVVVVSLRPVRMTAAVKP